MAARSRSRRTTRPPKKQPPEEAHLQARAPKERAQAPPRSGRPGAQPAWSRPRLPPSRMRCARRSPAFWPSAICSRPPISTSASGAGSTPSRPARNTWRAWRRCSSMPREAAVPGSTVRQDFFDLRTLARNAGDSLAGRAAAKGLQSPVEISDKLPAFVVGDPVRLRAALENLIDNAVKFTEAGQRRAAGVAGARRQGQGRRRLRGFRQRHRPVARPRSSGCSARSRRPMSRSPSRFGGAGLGLSSVKQIARAMGGDIAVTQRRGGGTTFTLTVVHGAGQGAGDDHGRRATAMPPIVACGRCACLSVEDNPFGRVVLNAILTELGHQRRIHRPGRGRGGADRARQRSMRC